MIMCKAGKCLFVFSIICATVFIQCDGMIKRFVSTVGRRGYMLIPSSFTSSFPNQFEMRPDVKGVAPEELFDKYDEAENPDVFDMVVPSYRSESCIDIDGGAAQDDYFDRSAFSRHGVYQGSCMMGRVLRGNVVRFFTSSSDEDKNVKLKNGSLVSKVCVVTTMMNLKLLLESNPIAFYELVMKCRDSDHVFFGNTEEVLKGLALKPDNSVVKNIVLSAVEGEEFDMRLNSPIADDDDNEE